MIKEQNNFLALVDKAMLIQGRSHMRPVIEKELLHYDILFVLNKSGLLDRLTFQGGTSLRLCYGALRFSEDLDFAGGYDFEAKHLFAMKNCLENYLTKHYQLEVSVKEPKDIVTASDRRNVNVSIWQIRLVTHPESKNLPKQMIKLEVANIPAYTREPKLILSNYDFLPDGYTDVIMMVETLDEILADKIIAFICCQTHVRYRDIWDFNWLKKKNAKLNLDLVLKKVQDYKVKNFDVYLDNMKVRLHEIIHARQFKDEMSRFLPFDVQERTLLHGKFLQLLENEIHELLNQIIL